MLPEPVLIGLMLVTLFGALALALALGGSSRRDPLDHSEEVHSVSSTHG